METVIKKLCLFLLVTFIASCIPHDHEIITYTEEDYQELDIKAELSGSYVKMIDGSTFALSGNSNCNLADNTCVSITGVVRNLNNGNFEVKNGNFRIMAESTGCFLFGDFQGIGKNYFMSDITMGGVVKVDCGTGVFQADKGELDLRITGMDSNGNFITEINGLLKK